MHRLLLMGFFIGVAVLIGCKKDSGVVSTSTAITAQAVKDDARIQSYIAANNLQGKFMPAVKDSTGLYYMITRDTTDATLYSSSTLVTVGYTGSVINTDNATESVFTQTGNIHPSFTLGQVIRGWSLCIPHCNKGGTIRILMASRYAYGPYAQPNYGLKPNSVLDFTITLYDVTN